MNCLEYSVNQRVVCNAGRLGEMDGVSLGPQLAVAFRGRT